MFGIFADLASSVITILFPVFASWKALRSSDPAQLAPWLMYWVVLSGVLLAESWTVWILGWFPFYSWIRLGFLCYLVLPQTQGARFLYEQYVDPYLEHHEREIDELIGRAHERAKAAGLQYLNQAIDLFREKVLGLPPLRQEPAAPPPPTGPAAYAQSLLSRFNIPATTTGGASAPSTDLFSMLSSAVTAVTSPAGGKSGDTQAEALASSSSTLLPSNLADASPEEKAKFIATQRQYLEVLRSALAKEERSLGNGNGGESSESDDLTYGLRKNLSDNSFDHIEHDDVRSARDRSPAGWSSGLFGANGEGSAPGGPESVSRRNR
ncbi:hypothetical protein VTN00DRAFT_366 [Thermoascus crustaceus]|uniref:uncharacterized protein n=1 Tax=Thermoascus crustaceus TaxID=5088 RepID=UPI0037433F8A